MRGVDAAAEHEHQQVAWETLLRRVRLCLWNAHDLRERAATNRWCAQQVRDDRQRLRTGQLQHEVSTAPAGSTAHNA